MTTLLQRWRHEALHNRIAVNAKDGSVMVYVPPGEFTMGDGVGENCLAHPVELSGYWIGVYAVTNAQYLKFVEETGHAAPGKMDYGTRVWRKGQYAAEKADHPVVGVSWEDSVAYAAWAGCELATEAQWEKAARGLQGLVYPWGNEWDASKCRYAGNRGDEETCRVHGYPEGASGYGTYNQSGNVWEWCADWYDWKYYRNSPKRDPQGPDEGQTRVYRGGSWWYLSSVKFRAADRYGYFPAFRGYYLGLRLVRNATGNNEGVTA
jgi:formylglycine-generating enzyme required for sulfatase activity